MQTDDNEGYFNLGMSLPFQVQQTLELSNNFHLCYKES